VPFAQVRTLVCEHGGQFGVAEQGQGAGADHDLGAQAGHAVGGGGGMVKHERARHLGVAVGEQGEQFALAPASVKHRDPGGHQHPAEQREQRQAGAEKGQPDHDQDGGALPARERPGKRQGAGGEEAAGHRDAQQRAHRCRAAGQAERLPQGDGGGRGAARPAGSHQDRDRRDARDGDNG